MEMKTRISRRALLACSGLAAASFGAGLWWPRSPAAQTDHHGLSLLDPASADEALKRLVAGNRCYVEEHFAIGDERRTLERRLKTSERQRPYAVILACADSRVAPDIVFSAGLGDLFVVRVAGNIVAPHCYAVLGSLEYAVEELKVPLVMVLGHEGCGAVKAAIRVVQEGVKLPSAIASIAAAIRPTVENVMGISGDLLSNAVAANVLEGVRTAATSGPILASRFAEGHLKIVGGVYDLKTGYVRLLD